MRIVALQPLALTLVVAGCAASAPVITRHKMTAKPELHTVQTEDVGAAVLSFEQGSSRQSIRIRSAWGLTPSQRDLPPQVLIPLETGPRLSKFLISTMGPGTPQRDLKVCLDKVDSSVFMPNALGACDLLGKAIINSGPLAIEPAEYIDPATYYLKRELVYAGRSGTTIRFVYRESSNAYGAQPISHEVNYDLNESMVVGYKGARIEVLNATSNAIKYRLMRHFEL